MQSFGKYKVDLSTSSMNDVRVIAYDYISPGSKVLDVGCACGDFGVLLANGKRCLIDGIDCDPDSLIVAADTGAYQSVKCLDLNAFKIEAHQEWSNKYDFITLLDVLEHTYEPLQVLGIFKSFIKKSGYVIISLPNIAFGDVKMGLMNNEFFYTETGILDSTHLKFFTWKTIALLLAKCGLEVVEARPKLSNLDHELMQQDITIASEIKSNPHSYVYQYVAKCKISNIRFEELLKINYEKMDIRWGDIRVILFALQGYLFLKRVIPEGTSSMTFIKKIYRICNSLSKRS